MNNLKPSLNEPSCPQLPQEKGRAAGPSNCQIKTPKRSSSVVLDQGHFAPPGDIQQWLQIFLIFTTGEQRPEMLLNSL